MFEAQEFYEGVLGRAISEEAFYDAVFSQLPWFPAYVIDKARRFEAFRIGYPLPECTHLYSSVGTARSGEAISRVQGNRP